MTVQTARILARLWLVFLLSAFALNISSVVLGEWRRTTSTLEPTPTNSAAYEEHGQQRYAAPTLVRCHALTLRALPFTWLSFLLYSLCVAIAANQTGATGRRPKPNPDAHTRQP